jgi:hypothetical protein
MTDDQQRIQALLDERAKVIRERDGYAQDLAELLDAARGVRVAANVTTLALEQDPGLAEAIDELAEVLARFDDEAP